MSALLMQEAFMDDALYQVIITGHVLEPVPQWRAVSAFASLFSISPEEALIRFQAAPCVVRGMLSLEQAEKYCRVLQRQGVQCEMRQETLLPQAAGLYPRH
ncbi:MAG: hypothetical protein REI12_07045 [Pedobacter sp.]|nr:hypothetical protein [Pedobacter sp.]